MTKDDFCEQLKNFINENKKQKIGNKAINQQLYDKVLERKIANKTTNVRSITNLTKLVQYYLASKMLDFRRLSYDVENYVRDLTNSYTAMMDFENMFSEVEVEFPEYRIPSLSKLQVINNKLIYKEDATEIEVELQDNEVTYKLLENEPVLASDCWNHFEYTKKAPMGGINTSVPLHVFSADIKIDKSTGKCTASDVILVADYPITGLNIIARYSGLHNTAWITSSHLDGSSGIEHCRACDWTGSQPINRGTIYLTRGNSCIASIKGDWDGY